MELEDQVCSYEQAVKLEKLSVISEAYFSYVSFGKTEEEQKIYKIMPTSELYLGLIFNAYSVAELMELLPNEYRLMKFSSYWRIQKVDHSCNFGMPSEILRRLLLKLRNYYTGQGKEIQIFKSPKNISKEKLCKRNSDSTIHLTIIIFIRILTIAWQRFSQIINWH